MAGSKTVIVTPDFISGGIVVACQEALQALILQADNAIFSDAGLTHGTTAADVKTANTINYRIDGQNQAALTTQDDFWTLTGAAMSAGQIKKWLLCVNSSAAASVVESSTEAVATDCTFADVVGSDGNTYPAPGPSLCVVGSVQVKVNSSTFTPGTTSLAAGTITVTYVNGYDATLYGAAIPFDRL